MPQYLSLAEVKALSLPRPLWEPGDTLRLDYPKSATHPRFHTVGTTHVLDRLVSCGPNGEWMVYLDGNRSEYYAGRFSLASKTRPRLITNHKIGAPKGRLP